MKKARITSKEGYDCAPQGHTVITIPFGEEVEGRIAEWALSDRAASAIFDPVQEKKVTGPSETKKRGSPHKKD